MFKNNNIDLNLIKVAIFDFDETLALHKSSDYMKTTDEDMFISYYVNAYNNPENFYEVVEPCIPNEDICKLISILRNKKIKIYYVSGMKFTFNLEAKRHFVHKFFDKDIEVFSSGSQTAKIDATKIIAKINNCKLNEILFIDDIKKNIRKLNKSGVCSIMVDDVSSLIEMEDN